MDDVQIYILINRKEKQTCHSKQVLTNMKKGSQLW